MSVKHLLILATIALSLASPALAQSSADIESLIKSSKLVDTRREMKATLGAGGEVIISTYCDSKASDKDCKITTLLILKELSQHYKNIVQVRASFFDQFNAVKYRTVVVDTRHVQLVDSGKPIGEVLAVVPIASGVTQNSSNYVPGSGTVKPGAYYHQRLTISREIKSLIDRGGREDKAIESLARFEQYCTGPNPDTRVCTNMYHALLTELDNQETLVSRQRTTTTTTVSDNQKASDQIRRNLNQQMIERMKEQISNSGGDTSGLNNMLQDIERTVRSSGH